MEFVDVLLHLDKYLNILTQSYGTWIYLILFLIIFSETGLVVAPFLPGDSLLFVAGAVAAGGAMDVNFMVLLLLIAAFSGDNANYWVGRFVGPKIFTENHSRLFRKDHLDKTHAFYEKHGGKTVIFARFLPVIRTFAPFVAGVGSMTYKKFLAFSLLGGASWVGFFVYLGFFFGNAPVIKQNLSAFIVGIVVISFLPAMVGFVRHKLEARN